MSYDSNLTSSMVIYTIVCIVDTSSCFYSIVITQETYSYKIDILYLYCNMHEQKTATLDYFQLARLTRRNT